jgi:hypothetical protein
VNVLTPALDQKNKHYGEANGRNDADEFDVSHIGSPFLAFN